MTAGDPRPDLLHAVAVEPVGDDRFRGHAADGRPERIFGGQVMAQALAAAGRTVGSDRLPHHLHANFVRGGLPDQGVELQVAHTADLGSFTHRAVRATQGERHLLDLTAAFHRPESGPTHAPERTAEPDDPETLPTLAELRELDGYDSATGDWITRLNSWLPVEVRTRKMPGRVPAGSDGGPPTRLSMWMRSHHPLPDDPVVHACAAAYVSDMFLLTTALASHGLRLDAPGLFAVTLNHAIWFHAPLRLDDWVLYEEESVSSGAGRMLCRGQLLDRHGRLAATVVQEGLLRLREGAPREVEAS